MLLMAFEDITKEKELETLKDNFISVASHELKTPITAAWGYIQLFERQIEHLSLAPAPTTSMEKTKQQLLKLNDMVHQLLDLSKVTSGTHPLDFTEFSMDTLVREVIENHTLINPDAEIHIHGSVGRNISADRLRIEQVLNNLIGNAIKYCFGSARVHIELSVTDNSSSVQVCISDNGIGIPVGEKERLFGLFSRASNAIRRKIPGVGLGLNISSEIIKKHGGNIWVESDGTNGSTFCFTIPIDASME
ncbi:sensor histidine kinase [Olivibacter sp. XZL3]|uniref:sensor histidine kinase n=1 Tax=Olivibacter sp. XZL3 TaxID=1735116 RepID=UPI00351A2F9F